MSNFALVDITSSKMVCVHEECDVPPIHFQDTMRHGFDVLDNFIKKNEVIPLSFPCAIYTSYNDKIIAYDLGVSVSHSDADKAKGSAQVHVIDSYEGKALKYTHTGPYRHLSNSWRILEIIAKSEGLTGCDQRWETFISDPNLVSEDDLETELYLPVVQNRLTQNDLQHITI
jgi:effector-binding domain-containing protein